ncbi:DNA gyrase inhibitor YacG [Marivivens marinus]|uniref:DNA gyrase inhibitor YacG n=1 Tax=Marivivens marinus TaxID=3110173 RepID=UPI003B848E2E
MTCPICGKQTDPKARPFCSKRCADIDLGKWLSGSYAIPSEDPEEAEEALREMEEQLRKPH